MLLLHVPISAWSTWDLWEAVDRMDGTLCHHQIVRDDAVDHLPVKFASLLEISWAVSSQKFTVLVSANWAFFVVVGAIASRSIACRTPCVHRRSQALWGAKDRSRPCTRVKVSTLCHCRPRIFFAKAVYHAVVKASPGAKHKEALFKAHFDLLTGCFEVKASPNEGTMGATGIKESASRVASPGQAHWRLHLTCDCQTSLASTRTAE